MPAHSSSRPGWSWQRWLRGRLAIVAADIRAPLRTSEVIASWSDEFFLQPGHPWEAIRCLICAQPPGGRAMLCAVLLGASVTSGRYYRPGANAYLIHADHGRRDPIELWIEAHRLESPGCPCHTRPAGETMSYPYHQL